MTNFYTTEHMINVLESLIVGDDITSEEVDLFESVAYRLQAQLDHINWMRDRLALAERVIGELYLMQREIEE